MGLSFRILAIFFLVPSFSLFDSFHLPNNETFSKWTREMELKLSDLVAAVTQADFGRSVYKSDPNVVLEKVDGEEVLKSVLSKISEFFDNKRSALRNLVNRAEGKFPEIQKANRSMLAVKDLSFFNMKNLKQNLELTFDPRFRQKVSFKQSGVHIPLEIFDGYAEILNGLNWTASLDEVFKENWKKDPTLRWQYFGSVFGFTRVYPGFMWPDHPSVPDLFDVRRRSWYIQGLVTPKDVIILIDRSGSVHGPTLDIMKVTARALLNSLGEDDYVNVAWFNNKVKWMIPCIDTLVQATAQTRRLLGDAIERLTESNLTSYATALDFAFEAFRKFDERKKPWTGSNCHKIIMFLSDGGTEWPSELVTKHCNESRSGRIKIFTFACGPHPIPTVVLKEMACATGGYFSPITALGSVRVKIQDYVKVLSRPLAYSRDNNIFHWHNFYRDVGGLGIVTTLTLPVFNRGSKISNKNNTQLLGVMGLDIPVKEMVDLFPQHILGFLGYPFSININGFLVFHPRLHDHIVYIEDPPDIYLTDLEGMTEEMMNLEKMMIDGSFGSLKSYQSILPLGSGHAILVDMDYFYGSVNSSTFRFGVAIPSKQTIAKIRLSDITKSASLLSVMTSTLIAPWKFCSTDGVEDFTIESLSEIILNNYSSCDENLINHLLWDVEKVTLIKTNWNQTSSPEILSRFLITSSGLTVHSLSLEDEYTRQADPYKNNIFKRASATAGYILSVEKGRPQIVTVAGKILYEGSYITAVFGAEIQQYKIQEIFDVITKEEGCQSSDLLHCYLVNDGGIIITSNRVLAKPGDFVGLHDPELLEALLSASILKREFRYNYHSWCYRNSDHVQATAATYRWSIFKFLYEIIFSFHWNYIYTTLLYFISSVTALKRVENPDSLLEMGNHSCVSQSVWYYHSGLLAHSGSINCETHQRSFRAAFLPNVTLMLVIAQPHCKDPQSYRPITLDIKEDIEPMHCNLTQRYRVRPEKCYSTTPKDIFSDCGASSSGHIKSLATLALFWFFITFTLLQ